MINGVSVRGGSDATAIEPLDEQVDHVRGAPQARVILEYGDYECPYSRAAYREIEKVEHQLSGGIRATPPNSASTSSASIASGQVLGTPTLFIDGVTRYR
jgi:hypothetical protein